MSCPKSIEFSSMPSTELPTTKTSEAIDQPTQCTEEKPENKENELEYPNGLALTSITIGLCLSVFLVALDQTVIATAIPKITDQFHSLKDVSWYGSAYLMTMSCFQLPVGKLYTIFPTKWFYLTAIAVFEIGSAVCGAAPNSITLIVGRAIQGMGCSGLVSGAFIILSKSVPLHRRPMFAGIIGSMFAISSVCGPPIGGALTDRVTWRWCFFINLPLGAFTILLLALFFRPTLSTSSQPRSIHSFLHTVDLPGIFLLFPAVIALILALTWGGLTYSWSDWRIILLLVVSATAFTGFIILQIFRSSAATVPAHLLKQRSILCACIVGTSMGAAMMTNLYFLPLYFQAIKRASPVRSGIMILPTVASDVGFSIIAGVSISALGYYVPFMLAGGLLFTAGAALLHMLDVYTPTANWVGYQILVGAGSGLITQQSNIAVQAVLPAHDIPIGTALVVFFQTLGGAVFLAVAQAIFDTKLIHSLAAVLPGGDMDIVQSVLNSGAVDLASSVPPQYLSVVLDLYAKAVTTPFIVSATVGGVAFLGSLGMEWVSVKGKNLMAGPAE